MAEKELISERRRKLGLLLSGHVYPFGRRFDRRTLVGQVTDNSGPVRLAGRIMAIRSHGKASFIDIQDISGRIQTYFQKGSLPDKEFELLRLLDIGDIIGIEGEPFRTRTGELTIKVSSFTLLSKALRPLPEKWHGLKEIETRFRQRYLDLIANQEVREIFVKRSQILNQIRRYLDEKGFLEVETPMMHPIPGGAEARPFITHHNTFDADLYLRIAPELYLKRLLVGGLEKVYEINRSFRNEGVSSLHNPEFTMLELYAAYEDYHTMADLAEELICTLFAGSKLAQKDSQLTLEYQGQKIDLSPPWRRVTLSALMKEAVGIERLRDLRLLAEIAQKENLPLTGKETAFDLVDLIFRTKVQPSLLSPVFVMDYPKEVSPLAKSRSDDPDTAERFELFIAGLEIGNAYSELNDPDEQRRRFEEEVRSTRPDRPKMVDEDYLLALSYGMPPAGGLGIGIDRLVMLLTNQASIREVILFPLLRSLQGE